MMIEGEEMRNQSYEGSTTCLVEDRSAYLAMRTGLTARLNTIGESGLRHAYSIVAFLVLVLCAAGNVCAEEGCGVPTALYYSGAPQDYPIPADASGNMTFICKGGDGGDAVLVASGSYGDYEMCRSNGGKGAEVTATFAIGTGTGELAPGGTLRFIVGGAGQSGTSYVNFFYSGSEFGGGGAGSAVLYRSPSNTGDTCSDWQILVVGGGGGGAHTGATLLICGNGRPGDSGQTSTSGSSGGNSGGAGGTNGSGGGGGHNGTGGGGGANSAGTAGSSGGAGCPHGANGGGDARNGAYGFGGGGGADGAGGGGGGYSGGGGGGNSYQGGGGGSYVGPAATNVTIHINQQTDRDGSIRWSAPAFFVNDHCENAIPIADGSIIGCTTSATVTVLPPFSCPGGVDIWYSYANDGNCDRQVTASASSSGLTIYDACGGAEIACAPFSELTWTIPAGATHYIRVSTTYLGLVQLDVRSRDSSIGSNPSPIQTTWTTVGHTASGLSSCFGSIESPDALYDYVNLAGVPEMVTASTCGNTDFDTVLSVHEKCSGTQIVCNSDTCGDQSEVSWIAKPGIRYTVRVAGENGAVGNFEFNLNAAVINDTCATAIPLHGYAEYFGDFYTPTSSGVGDGCAPGSDKDMWFSYTNDDPSGCLKVVRFHAGGSHDPARYALFADCGTPLQCLNELQEQLISVAPGNTIFLRVSGNTDVFEESDYHFTFDEGMAYATKGVDPGLPRTTAFIIAEFPIPPEQQPSCGSPVAGYEYDHFINTLGYPVRIRGATCEVFTSGNVDTVLSAQRLLNYEVTGGYDPCYFQEYACNDNSNECAPGSLQSVVYADVAPGEYAGFLVCKKNLANADMELNLSIDSTFPPTNDDCANALPIGDETTFGVNTTATNDGPASTCAPAAGKDVWYSYTNTSDCARRVTADTCAGDTEFNAIVSVFDGCNGSELACGVPEFGCRGSRATFIVNPGQTVLIRVSSAFPGSESGRFRLKVSSELIDPFGFGLPGNACTARNDVCANALPLVDGVMPGTLAGATHDVNSSCADGPDALADVWYTYTNRAACNMTVTNSTCLFDNADAYRSLSAYDGCGGTELVCNSGDSQKHCATISWSIPSGATHVIRVSGVQSIADVDNFSLTVTSVGVGDIDGDGVENACDNCYQVPNANQADADGDGFGDACDICPGFDDAVDSDGDTVPDGCDQCPDFDDAIDADGDGKPDACDPCPNDNPDDLDGNGQCGAQVFIRGTLQSGVTHTGNLNPAVVTPGGACQLNRPETFRFWTFHATAGDSIMIEVDRLESSPDPMFSIWQGDLGGTPLLDFTDSVTNPNQTLLLTRNDEELPAPVDGDGGDPALVGYVAPYTGTYTVLVAGNCISSLDSNLYSIRLDLNAEATIHNVTLDTYHPTIQNALDIALDGNVIEISAGYVFENDIQFPNGLDVTLRGAGPGKTFIDAESTDFGDATTPAIQMVDSGQTSATVISDLTIQKDSDISGAFGAMRIKNASPRIENVAFVGNYGDGYSGGNSDVTVSGAASNVVFSRCQFFDPHGGAACLETSGSASVKLINCAFDQSRRPTDGNLISSMRVSNGTAQLVNCTVGGPLEGLSGNLDIVNCAFLLLPQLSSGMTINHSLHPGATGNNIDGTPTLFDEANNDLRLTESSLGIDAADYDAYAAAGGGSTDAGGQARAFDDPNTADSGVGVLTYLDMGAYEYFIDSDGDGIGDGSDVCPGYDDTIDTDADGTPDGCDPCPNDFFNDSDGDGVCDSADVCAGYDDTIDTDGDGTPDCAEPVGDECPYAQLVGNGDYSGDMLSYSGGTGVDDTCSNQNTIDKWFRYQSSVEGTLTISTCGTNTQFDSIISVFDGCPESGGQQLACNDDSLDATPECRLSGLNRLSNVSLPVTIGQAVYVRLSVYNDNFLGTGGIGTLYEINFNAEGDGDDCGAARTAVAGVNVGTLADNTGSTGVDDSCGNSNSIDEWFVYAAPASGLTTFSTCSPNTGFNTVLSLWNACPSGGGAELACNNDMPGEPTCELEGFPGLSRIEWNVSAGQTYFLRVSAMFNVLEPNGPGFELIIVPPTGCISGDLNGDTMVTPLDIPQFSAAVLAPESASADEFCAADVNQDGNVDGNDVHPFVSLILTP